MPLDYDDPNIVRSMEKHRAECFKPAIDLLTKIFNKQKRICTSVKHLDVLVAFAGTFPSFAAWYQLLPKKFPNIQSVQFTLLDNDKLAMDYFTKKFQIEDKKQINQIKPLKSKYKKWNRKDLFEIKFEIVAKNFDDYLKETTDKFDIIFLEHPPVGAYQYFLGKIRAVEETSNLRAAMAFIPRICKKNTLVIMCCQQMDDLLQAKRLLNYIGGHSETIQNKWNVLLPEQFGKGVFNSERINKKNIEQMQHAFVNIEFRDTAFSFFVMMTISFCLDAIVHNDFFRGGISFFAAGLLIMMHDFTDPIIMLEVALVLPQAYMLIKSFLSELSTEVSSVPAFN